MAENDNNNGRPIKATPGARPAETLVTNNNNGRIRINDAGLLNDRKSNSNNPTTKQPTPTPTKKGK